MQIANGWRAAGILCLASTAAAQGTQRVSLTPAETEFTAPTAASFVQTEISGDGSYAFFTYPISSVNTGAPCNEATNNLFRRDLTASGPGTTVELVCFEYPIFQPRSSYDGSVVAFLGGDSILGPAPFQERIFVATGAGTVDLVSVDTAGGYPTGGCRWPSITDGGDLVAFDSNSDDLTLDAGLALGDWHVYVRDRVAGTTTLLDRAPGGGALADDFSQFPEISGDGAWVVFLSRATNLVPGFGGTAFQLYAAELATGAVRLLSKDATGAEAAFPGLLQAQPRVSTDGRFVAYLSSAANLPGGGGLRVRVHDRDSDGNGVFDEPGGFETFVGSVDTLGNPVAVNNTPSRFDLSGDGQRLVWWSTDFFVVPNPTPSNFTSVFVNTFASDLRTDALGTVVARGQAREVYLNRPEPAGPPYYVGGLGQTNNVAISGDGGRVVFQSRDNPLLDPAISDTNGLDDFYAHDVCNDTTTNLGFWKAAPSGRKPELWICGDPSLPGIAEIRMRRATPAAVLGLVVNAVRADLFVPLIGGTIVPSLVGGGSYVDTVMPDGTLTVPFLGPFPAPLHWQYLTLEGTPMGTLEWSLSNALVTY